MDKILRELKPSKKLIKLSIEKQKEHFDLVNSKYDYLMY